FEGRIHALVKANYLASPPLVVAYALAGTVDIDLQNDVIGMDKDGNDVYLKDLWPSQQEILDAVQSAVTREQFEELYDGIEDSNPRWNAIETSEGAVYDWQDSSTYIQEPPFFMDVTPEIPGIESIEGARTLVKAGDSTTTDHISPAGAIPKSEPAGQFLQDRGVEPKDFNSFGSRRGNDRVMTRGTFGNIRLRNHMAPGTEGGWTMKDGEKMYIYDAAQEYEAEGTPLVVFAGNDYGMGSSRDWAAKGTLLLGIKAVVAKSFERIHRSNLVGMGVLPLLFQDGEGLDTHGLDGTEAFDIPVGDDVQPGDVLEVTATKDDGTTATFDVTVALNTPVEVEYYRHGGILNYVLRDFLNNELEPA
ncbi:MAG: aconitate hydratase, partial [Rubrivirga sp.]